MDRRLTVSEIAAEAVRMGFRPTTEKEIRSAIAIGVQGTPGLTHHSRASRFWAAIRRKQTDCSRSFLVLGQISDLAPELLELYRHSRSDHYLLFSPDEFDQAAASLLRQNP